MWLNIAQERKNSFNYRANRNGKGTENGKKGRKEGGRRAAHFPFLSPSSFLLFRPAFSRSSCFVPSFVSFPFRPCVACVVSVSVPVLPAFRCSAWFRFRFRPDRTGHDTRPQGSHTKRNRPTGACWFRFGKHRTRGEGRGAIPLLLSDSSGGGLLFNVPISFLANVYGGPTWSPLGFFTCPSLPFGASFLAPRFVSLPACLQQRVPRVVSGTFLCLELVINSQNGKIFPFLVEGCTFLFSFRVWQVVYVQGQNMVVIGF